MTNGEIRESLLTLARVLTTHVTRGIDPRVNVVESTMNVVEITMTSTLRDFMRINPTIFL